MVEILNQGLNAKPFVDMAAANTALEELLIQITKQFCRTSGEFSYRDYKDSALQQRLESSLVALKNVDLGRLQGNAQKTAFWLNIYNALAIQAVIHYRIEKSVRDQRGFFRLTCLRIGGQQVSLNDIEHGMLRANQPPYGKWTVPFGIKDPRREFATTKVDPRIHFAMYSACNASPLLGGYGQLRLGQGLEAATKRYLKVHVLIDPVHKRLKLPKMFLWYKKDFGEEQGIREFLQTYLDAPELALLNKAAKDYPLEYTEFDWQLNGLPV